MYCLVVKICSALSFEIKGKQRSNGTFVASVKSLWKSWVYCLEIVGKMFWDLKHTPFYAWKIENDLSGSVEVHVT